MSRRSAVGVDRALHHEVDARAAQHRDERLRVALDQRDARGLLAGSARPASRARGAANRRRPSRPSPGPRPTGRPNVRRSRPRVRPAGYGRPRVRRRARAAPWTSDRFTSLRVAVRRSPFAVREGRAARGPRARTCLRLRWIDRTRRQLKRNLPAAEPAAEGRFDERKSEGRAGREARKGLRSKGYSTSPAVVESVP